MGPSLSETQTIFVVASHLPVEGPTHSDRTFSIFPAFSLKVPIFEVGPSAPRSASDAMFQIKSEA